MKNDNLRFWIKLLFAPIFTGLMVAVIWHLINVIKAYNIQLCSPYAYEYNYKGATSSDPARIIDSYTPIKLKINTDMIGKLRLGIKNINIRTLKNVSFHIEFPDGIRVVGSKGWTVWNPNKTYFLFSEQSINNEIISSFEPLDLQFSEPKTYEIWYTITGEDIKYIQRKFLIEVVKT